jgi:hypothetical protein
MEPGTVTDMKLAAPSGAGNRTWSDFGRTWSDFVGRGEVSRSGAVSMRLIAQRARSGESRDGESDIVDSNRFPTYWIPKL